MDGPVLKIFEHRKEERARAGWDDIQPEIYLQLCPVILFSGLEFRAIKNWVQQIMCDGKNVGGLDMLLHSHLHKAVISLTTNHIQQSFLIQYL